MATTRVRLAFAAGVSIVAANCGRTGAGVACGPGNLADGLRERAAKAAVFAQQAAHSAGSERVGTFARAADRRRADGAQLRSAHKVIPVRCAERRDIQCAAQFLKYLTTQSRANFANQLGERWPRSWVRSVGGVTPPLAGGEQYAVGSYGRSGDPDDVYRANKADYKSVLPGYFEG